MFVISLPADGLGGVGTGVHYAKCVIVTLLIWKHGKSICTLSQISRYPCGAIILRGKAICWKHVCRLVSVSVDYMLSKRCISDGITHKRRVLFLVVNHYL